VSFTVPERGGFKGWIALPRKCPTFRWRAADGPIKFKAQFDQGEDVFRRRARCLQEDADRARLRYETERAGYMVYSDHIALPAPAGPAPMTSIFGEPSMMPRYRPVDQHVPFRIAAAHRSASLRTAAAPAKLLALVELAQLVGRSAGTASEMSTLPRQRRSSP